MTKSPDAFRTISEVADWLDVPTHVLRFWESRFTQVKPVKRTGGRRYYRPTDMELLGGIKRLLHDEGLTIRGVQKLLREEGIAHVCGLSPKLESGAPQAEDGTVMDAPPPSDVQGSLDIGEVPGAATAPMETTAEPDTTPQPVTQDPDSRDEGALAGHDASDAEPDAQTDAASPKQAEATAQGGAADAPEPQSAEAEAEAPPTAPALAGTALPDLDAMPDPAWPITPLVAMGGVARQREAETFAPIAARAKALLRDLNVRM